jgi:CDP-diglyceride synthetase
MDVTQIIFAPILPFVGHPDRIAVVATLFLVGFVALKIVRHVWSWPLLWTAGLWVAFAIWEWSILVQEANIRVDLILIYPILLGVTIWGLWAGVRSYKNRKQL